MDATPENSVDVFTYKYNCPICLRYYNGTFLYIANSHTGFQMLWELYMQRMPLSND